MLTMHCKTPEPSPNFDKTEFTENPLSKYQYNVQTLRSELDKVIVQNINGKNSYFTLHISTIIYSIYVLIFENVLHYSNIYVILKF